MTKKRQNGTQIVLLVLNALFLRMRETELERKQEKNMRGICWKTNNTEISLSHDRKQVRERILTERVKEKTPPERWIGSEHNNTHLCSIHTQDTMRDASRIQKREEEASDIQRVRKRRGPEMDEILGCVVELVSTSQAMLVCYEFQSGPKAVKNSC
ncbi:hypothetical protein Pcinc_032073 [Petrolisthes cinctipes]|uniref:Uncharacterized protein n=1 Tax=Petrolisthes cinctipes TaxID=88211 RepID=A0AAE1JZV3_PETCI|nr:hypothetical protein Pcinc_032073 [Petrolisthes cinctipes]